MPDYAIVIPARYASERLPGKALLDLGGKPMVCRVLERARQSSATEIVVATDDERIVTAVEREGGEAVLTSKDHTSGSDRIAECARKRGWGADRLIVNLQGDEPLMPAPCLDQVARLLADAPDAAAATLCWPIESAAQVGNPNVVKVVFDPHGNALWFSRSAIPHARDWPGTEAAMAAGVRWYRHLGLYAYRYGHLEAFAQLEPSPQEQLERLEQLRFLENGHGIRIAVADEAIPPGVDTPEDLAEVRALFEPGANSTPNPNGNT
ncbi:3-deoxy-manno-octulosonate cytidylyltransferase [Marinihelvus fidelis]|uniref:3-deoxy-manno-octulosonate cytidylyltransferase n=1 Tax=Marinihelvus fidelis TaxID=2613842 RepID=A0A5N0TDM5_9GAMM|nr:3-deoxy-manno-octulosonate cytidylyltransferase [Marinihelvus fidelis]KAA9131946.1 3-deoxy-manno-octulosonate cytidylyltransferase [Marinihelvus fidelis]